MRRQDKYIIGTAIALAGLSALIDIWRQNEELKQKGRKLTWEKFNGLRTFKWSAFGGISGSIIGNEIHNSIYRKECSQSFSSDSFIKKMLKNENIKSNPLKRKVLKDIKDELKATLYNTFADDLVTFPEDVGSLKKATALSSTYDGDVVLAVGKDNSFGTLENLSSTMHERIDYLYSDKAIVTKTKKATNLLFDSCDMRVSIDVLYGREIGNYNEDKKLNLYSRPNFFWQSGKRFKTDIGIQKNILVNKPKVREVVKAFKLYFIKNGLAVENCLIDQLVLEALSHKNYGTNYSVTENLLNSMDYICQKLNCDVINDYANSNNNLLRKIGSDSKATIINLLSSDLKKIELNKHYIREAFYQ